MNIPKILWNFWIDFKKDKSELKEILEKDIELENLRESEEVGVGDDKPPSNDIYNFPDYVQPYVRLMQKVHVEWDLRLITSKHDLLYWLKKLLVDDPVNSSLIENINFVIKIMNNNLINSAHRSDVARYFLLKYYGGVWADSTIIIFNPLDDLIEDKQLVLPYMALSRAMKLIFGNPKSKIYKKNSDESIKLNEIDYDKGLTYSNYKGKHFIMPENYFIASIPDHFIINNVLDQLKKLWNDILDKLNEIEDPLKYNDQLIRLLTTYMQDMVYGEDKIFTDATYDWLPTDEGKNKDIWFNTEKGVQPAYYLFNYIQLYNAIISECSDETIIEEELYFDKLNEHREFTNFLKMYKGACKTGWEKKDVCSNITISCGEKGNIYLFSAEYLRLFKNPNKDTEDEDQQTFYDILLNHTFKNNPEKFKQFLKEFKIYMYKVGGIQIKKSARLMNKLLKYENDKCYDIYKDNEEGKVVEKLKYKCKNKSKTQDLIEKHERFIKQQKPEGGRKRQTRKRRFTKKSNKNGKRNTKKRINKTKRNRN